MNQGITATSIGDRLRQTRLQRRLTHKQLAELVGMARSTISRIERGQRSARPKTLQRLADVLDVSQHWLLLDGDNDRQDA